MNLLNAQQIHAWDQYTITQEPIRSLDLMERAAKACVEELEKKSDGKNFVIFCGKGNNGGDGLAIARLLFLQNIQVQVVLVFPKENGSEDYSANLLKCRSLQIPVLNLNNISDLPEMDKNAIIIDAILGSGLHQPLHGSTNELVHFLNQQEVFRKIAIDVPTGLYLDRSSIGNCIFCANETYTFEVTKFCFLLAENAPYFGKLKVMEIGLDKKFLSQINTPLQLVDDALIAKIFRPRNPVGNKGTFGHALMIAGNKGKMGACLLAVHACLKSGVGLATCCIPEEAVLLLPSTFPEAMTIFRDKDIDYTPYKSIGIGPGLGIEEWALVKKTIQTDKPIVIDADALNMIALRPEALTQLSANTILTPHPKEFERLFGKSANESDRIRQALALTEQYPFTLVLKGHHTLIAKGGKGYFNQTGNSGLSKGGSGDTLTGILTSLLAQGYNTLDAAILGVYLHGLAADFALERETAETLSIVQLPDYFSMVFKKIYCLLD